MGDQALKDQFQLLQEQKMKRLLKKKNEANKTEQRSPPKEANNEIDMFIKDEDNLDLQLGNHNQNIRETDDYKDLQETVRELRDENGRLDKLLAEKEEEVKIIRRRWKAEREELAGGGIGSGNAASKIIEFSKKIRELNTTVEKERTKCQSLEKKLQLMEKSSAPISKSPPSKEETDILREQLEITKEKMSAALLKTAEGRNEIEGLKKDLKIAQKVLSREVGENVTFQSLLNGSSGWRGRQQQILALQLKVSDLQQQVDERNQGSNPSRNAFLNGLTQHDEKHRLAMRKVELERKEVHDKLQKELEMVKLERDSFKEKNSAARARNKIITQDLKNTRDQLGTLGDKGKHDDELVSALLREQQYLKEENERLKTDIAAKEAGQAQRILKASGDFHIEKSDNERIVTELKDEISIQEKRVKELEEEISQLRKGKSARPNQSGIPRPHSSATKRNDRFSPRPPSVARFDVKDVASQESKSMYEVISVEKEKLAELVQVLQRRNEEYVQDNLQKDLVLNEFRNSNASLQRQVEKLSLSLNSPSNRSLSSSKSGYAKKKSSPGIVVNKEQNVALEELETKLAIQLDNNDALKGALQDALKSKEDDGRYYQQILDQTKNIFLKGLREYKEAKEER